MLDAGPMELMSDDERAIHKLADTWMDASKSGEIDKVLELMADDVVFMVPGREPFGKEEFKVMSASMKNVGFEGRSEIRELKLLGNWAWIRNHIEVTVSPPGSGNRARRAGYTLTILRKSADGRWRVVRDANLVT
jgi:uncharacterized protein (TIGR02246 family)